ncbi:MAG: hypothetical protein IT299_06610 [Dehalococcoidia bacterium]|nr:hypothetical protein [Dehalococcoidia bacterium]
MRATLVLVLAAALGALGCTREVAVIPAASPSAVATSVATAPRPPSTTATARPPTPSPSASALAGSPTPIVIPLDPDAEPPGYARSCAAEFPWGRQVTRGFVCIEPSYGLAKDRSGALTALTIRGYAGGSFENNVVVDLVEIAPDGSTGRLVVRAPLTYRSPEIGMPGAWTIELVPTPPLPAPLPLLRVVAHFESPRDGSRVAEATLDLK